MIGRTVGSGRYGQPYNPKLPMEKIHYTSGLDLAIKGTPSADLFIAPEPNRVAVVPERIPFIKPKLHVREGDHVRRGSLLYTDKRCPEVRFLSPGGGRVGEIQFGPRRIIQKIVIDLDVSEKDASFTRLTSDQLPFVNRNDLVQALVEGGQWPLFREMPFHNIPDPSTIPPLIVVCLDRSDPFSPVPQVYLKGKENLFRFGLELLHKLAEKVLVSVSEKAADGNHGIAALATHVCDGPFPAGDPGAFVYRVKQKSEENRAWYINGQDILLMAELVSTGKYPVDRIFAVGGEKIDRCCHVSARMGYPLENLVGVDLEKTRLVAGGLLSGYAADPDSFMGLYETSLTAMADGSLDELFGFIRAGYSKVSASRTFFSRFNRHPLSVDCGLHGEERACINCGYCMPVCPVEIIPHYLLKCVLAEEIDEALALGLLDCTECGLCTFVCPSKIDLCSTFIQARDDYRKEIA